MPKQPAFSDLCDAMKNKQMRWELFLAEMDALGPSGCLLALIAPHYPKAGPRGGRPPKPLKTMLRGYFLQNWYALSELMADEMLHDSEAMRRFAGIELGDDRIPDETPILNLRHLMERHVLTETIFAGLNAHLGDKDNSLRSGSLVDAPSSTKRKAGARDPEISSTKKINDWYFGMDAHSRVDADSGVVHSLETSTARLHDSQVWDNLLLGEETSVWAYKGYVSAEVKAAFKRPGKAWDAMCKAPKGDKLHPLGARINRMIAMVRAKVEHPSRIVKRQFGLVRTGYRGLAKNRAQLFALGNLFLVRRRLMA